MKTQTLLSLFIFTATVFSMRIHALDVSNDVTASPDSLDCWNSFTYETGNMLDFTFTGESYPTPASIYFWDFGDGSTAEGQVATHSYTPGTSELLPVSLTTYHFSPSGDSCIAVTVQWVQVGNNPCTASYSYTIDSANSLLYNFTSLSSGPITNYFWDFGDGQFSASMDPQHLFQTPGYYTVCLTVSSDTSGFYCTDTYCSDVYADYSISAGFEVVLDTLSGLPNTYLFIDNSTGNPESWSWDFGDGEFSDDQNPVHQFNSSGDYTVCLEVTRSFSMGILYSDEICQDVETPSYFDFGGQVFLDNIPMNNFNGDTTVVDTGMAYLYRKYYNTLIPSDTLMFTTLGYYWFSQVRAGQYIVRIKLTENSMHYPGFLPSYNGHTITWQNAIPVDLSDTSNFSSEVHLKPAKEINPGNGTISGFVTYSGSANPLITNIESADVFLLDQDYVPIRFTSASPEGVFAFEGLSAGTYVLFSEATGLYSTTSTLEIDESTPNVFNIQLQLFAEMVDIPDHPSVPALVGGVYPNPVCETLFLDIRTTHRFEALIRIININGVVVGQEKRFLNENGEPFSIDVHHFPAGLYILTISIPTENEIFIRKFIK